MAKQILFFLLFFACMTMHAQDNQTLASQREAEADEYAKISYKHKDAYYAYLSAYRLYSKAGKQYDSNKLAILLKTRTLVGEEKYMVNQNAEYVDSLLSESYDDYKDNTETYLPLLESFIVKKVGISDKYKRSFELFDIAIKIRNRHNLRKGREYENILRWYSSHLSYDSNMTKSKKISIYDELWKVYRDNCSESDTLDVKLLDKYYGACGLEDGNEETKIMLLELKQQYVVGKYGKESDEYLKLLKTLSYDYDDKYEKDEKQGIDNGYKKKCIAVNNEIWTILNAKNDIYSNKAAVSVKLLIYDVLSYQKDTVWARELAEDYSLKIKSRLGDESDYYLNSLENIVRTYSGDEKALIPILEEKLKLEEKKYGTDDYRYKATEMSLSSVYRANHMLSHAISTVQRPSNKADYYQLLTEVTMQVQYGSYREALETYNDIMDLCLSQPETKYLILLSTPMAISNCFLKLKDLKGLLEFGRKWVNHPSLTADEQYSVFSGVMSSASNPSIASDDVLKFVDEYIVSHAAQMSDKEMLRKILSEKASVLYGMLKLNEAIEVIQNILTTIQPDEDNYIAEEIKYTSYYEICLLAKMDWKKALETNCNVMELLRQIPNYGLLCEYYSACARACLYYDQLGDYSKIIPVAMNVMSVDRSNMTQLNTDRFEINNFFALYSCLDESAFTKPLIHGYAYEGRAKDAKNLILNIVKEEESTIRFALSRLDTNEKTNKNGYINALAENLFSVAMLQCEDKELSQAAFNYCLLYKQAYLSSESLMRQQIFESGDSLLIKRFTDLQHLMETRQTCLQAGLDVAVIEEQIASLNIQIQEDSKAYGDYTRELNLKWKDIQNVLSNDDAVVEFVSYQDALTSEYKIGAIVLCKEWNNPKLVSLCSENELGKAGQYLDQIGSLVWTPILNMVGNVSKIYFVASGIINNIGIENVMVNGEYLSNKYTLLRMSSSRELVHKKSFVGSQAVLYGGIFYSHDELESSAPSNRAAEKGVPYLSGTKNEVEAINALILKMGGIPTNMLLGYNATESSIRKLMPLSTRVLHIATHGFYNPKKTENATNIYIFQNDNKEIDMLTRSGLLLANAQEALWGEYDGNADSDGILTSQEITTLDLRGMDLVVLSACETAKGEISSDGVFGLQRGFKKAGVNSILMSLWKVDDEATCKLMTEFYTNWIAKQMTKYDALEAAKKVVRETKGWEDPKYWAAFILLDALD